MTSYWVITPSPGHSRVSGGPTYRNLLTYDMLDKNGEYIGWAHFSGHYKHAIA
jgi:hypothetical protein